MLRRILILLLVFIIVFSLTIPAFAHNKDGHDETLSTVLFGNKFYISSLERSSKEYKNLEYLENAVAICLDLCNNTYNTSIYTDTTLQGITKNCHIWGFPSIEEICTPGGSNHRQYSHKGWNFDYSSLGNNGSGKSYQEIWNERKNLLVLTVKHVFSLHYISILGLESKNDNYIKCDSFAAFLYYIHILADIVPDEKTNKFSGGYEDCIKLTGENNIYDELIRILPLIFTSKENQAHINSLLNKLDNERNTVSVQCSHINESNYSTYQNYAKSLLDILSEIIPDMLKNETFFKKAFPSPVNIYLAA